MFNLYEINIYSNMNISDNNIGIVILDHYTNIIIIINSYILSYHSMILLYNSFFSLKIKEILNILFEGQVLRVRSYYRMLEVKHFRLNM